VEGVGGFIARMPRVKDDRAASAPAEHERRAQTRGSAPNDDDIKEIIFHESARDFTIRQQQEDDKGKRPNRQPLRPFTAMISKLVFPAFRRTRVLTTFPATRLDEPRNSYRRGTLPSALRPAAFPLRTLFIRGIRVA